MDIDLSKPSPPPDETEDFITSFDPKNESHVLWLRAISHYYKNIDRFIKYNLLKAICNNPLPGRPSMKDPITFTYIHQVLLSKYAFAVLECEAWVPDEPFLPSLE